MNNKEPNCKCLICGKIMYLKPFRLKRVVNGITCSKNCSYKLKAIYMKGSGNHQYGLKGNLNSSFIDDKIINQYGYIMIYLPNHPKSDEYGRYREHRYVIEKSEIYNDIYFDFINGTRVLKDDYIPHHINEIKTDNRLENLKLMTLSEHTKYHNKYKIIIRDDKTGKFIKIAN